MNRLFSILITTSILLFSLSYSLKAQKKYIFYSNADELSVIQALTNQLKDTERLEFISLGDNQLHALEEIKQRFPKAKQHYHTGDSQYLSSSSSKLLSKKEKHRVECPDPIVKELDESTVMIRINSEWFMDQELSQQALNENCNCINKLHFIETLEGVIEDNEEKSILLVAHHGITSLSEHNGKGLGVYNFFPFYGQLYQGYRKNIGHKEDLASPEYKMYINLLSKIVSEKQNIIFISAQDQLNSSFFDHGIVNINVSSGNEKDRYKKKTDAHYLSESPHNLLLSKVNGAWQLNLKSENQNHITYIENAELQESEVIENKYQTIVKGSVPASAKYSQGKLTQSLMGPGYRKEWNEPVSADLLDIDKYDGGMKPYDIGGGLQTMSIKFKSANGKKYAFRVLDKQPEKSLTEIARESVYKNIVQELITTMHPYSPLVAHHLIEQTDIIHIKPELFILDNHLLLNGKYKSFVGKLGTLEEKPKGKSKKRTGFAEADDVVSSFEMFAKLRKSRKHRLDKMSYAKARLMDMYLGDWDRHEDNWKWAVFEEGDKKVYKPIPKDRDHVFSKWTGMIPKIADKVINNAENFGHKFDNVRHLNFKARFLDRELGGELSLADWLSAAEYLQGVLTDAAIDEAVQKFPAEVYDFHGQEIKEKLKSRREALPRLVKEYYPNLTTVVDIVGTNKKDEFHLTTDSEGNLIITQQHNGRTYFERLIESADIEKVYLFGFAGNDKFNFDLKKTINTKVYIVGGEGNDEIEITPGSMPPKVKVYDTDNEDVIPANQNIHISRPSRKAHYDPEAFDYNWLVPNGTLRQSSGNGFGLGLGATYFKRGFNKPIYDTKTQVLAILYPELRAYRIDGKFTKRQFYKKTDLVINGRYSTLYDKFPFYYGLGNNSTFDRPNRRAINRIDYDILDLNIGTSKVFKQKSHWTNKIGIERHNVTEYKDVPTNIKNLKGYGANLFYKVGSELYLDFTDVVNYPTDGARLRLNLDGRYGTLNDVTGNFKARFSYFKSVDIGILATFVGAIKYQQALGESAFYHLSNLGSTSHFRGYTRNRFLDRQALLYNTEIRLRLGYIKTPLIRFVVGAFGFYDTGKVWNDSSEYYGNWNRSIGGGIYFAPGDETYAITLKVAKPDDDSIYTKLRIGFDF